MNTLENYITERIFIAERIRIDNIKQADWSKFPINGTPEQINDFLLSAGFKKLPSAYTINNATETVSAFNKEHTNIYYYYIKNSCGVIRFADTSYNEISKDNPMYEMWYNRNMKQYEFIINDGVNGNNIKQKDFMERLMNIFD